MALIKQVIFLYFEFFLLLRKFFFRLPIESQRSLSQSGKLFSAEPQLSSWVDALDEAERLVGCPASLSTLQSLFSNEMSTIATYIKKLEGSSHPLLEIARYIFYVFNYATML